MTRDRASPPPARPARTVRAKRRDIVLVCGKCLKRADDAKAIRRALADEATRRAGRKVRLVRTACLGLCPKRAVVAASAATLARGEMVILAGAGAAAGAAEILIGPDRSGALRP